MNSVTSARPKDGPADDPAGTPASRATGDSAPERAARALAQSRFDALAADVSIDCSKDPNPDLCGERTVQNPVLFAAQSGDEAPVDPADIQQRALGDCHLMAPLAALASTPAGRALVQRAITENRDASGQVVSYSVTLHRPESHVWGPTTFTAERYTFDGKFGEKSAVARQDGDHNEVWTLVMEKAFAQYSGGYSKIASPGSPAAAMQILTGKPASDIRLGTPAGYSASDLKRDVADGKLVILLSKKPVTGDAPPGVVGSHAYEVTGVEEAGGRLWVGLRNPWNREGSRPPVVAFDQLQRWFVAADVGKVR